MLSEGPVVPGSAEFYREKASVMLRLAEEAVSAEAKMNFLSLAKHWQRLAQNAEKPRLVM